MKILIVDDQPTNRKLLRVLFEGEGWNTIEAADGCEGLARLERESVDLVISDILMPNMDGYLMCHNMRERPALHDVPIILYSGTYTEAADQKLALSIGADKVLAKPCPNNVLLDCVRELIHEPKPREARNTDLAADFSVMQKYSEALVRKLEAKNLALDFTRGRMLQVYQELIERADGLERQNSALAEQVAALEARLAGAPRPAAEVGSKP